MATAAPAADSPIATEAAMPAPVRCAHMATQRPAMTGSALTESANVSQHSAPTAASDTIKALTSLVVVSVRSCPNGRAIHHHRGAT